ncbi:MAG: PAS domain S-box protein [Anaerolineae bacterium]|nr:PAS domain S-box protein [Anaerolineae bacterium]
MIDSKECSRVLFDRSTDGILFIDPNDSNISWPIVECNEAICRMNGYTRDEIIGQSIDILHQGPEDPAKRAAYLDRLRHEGPFIGEALHQRKDGTLLRIRYSASLVTLKGRELVMGIDHDLTWLEQLEASLNHERDLLDTLMDNSPDHIYFKDLESRFLRISQAHAGILGAAGPSDAIGKTDFDFFARVHAQEAYEDEQKIIQTGQPMVGIVEKNVLPDGRSSWVSTTKLPLRDKDGEIIGTFGISRDITTLKQAEEELQQLAERLERSNKELEEYARIASHDLQEPLRMISGYLQLLQRRYKGRLDSDADEFIEYAVDGANRLKRLINDILSYSRIETRGYKFEQVNCERVLRHTLATLKILVEANNAVITHDPLPTIMADGKQLEQLFQNLLDNAIKFRGEQRPQIHIGLERKGEEWLFFVRDNGIGFEPQYRDLIFSIFQRLHSKVQYAGTGIGLAICKRIVARHGGAIWAESQPGKGATFYFTIPIAPQAE